MDEQKRRPPAVGHVERCEACEYDLRGIDSLQYPECGTPKSITIAIDDTSQYHRAKAFLREAGLLVRSMDPGGALGASGNLSGRTSVPGWLWINVLDLNAAEDILDDLGIVTSLGARPIVDRTEPNCPRCSLALDPNGPELCPSCGAGFQWVEIDVPKVDSTGLICANCHYDLSGNNSENCPECGTKVRANLDAMVDAAARDGDQPEGSSTTVPSERGPKRSNRRVLIVECIFIAGLAFLTGALLYDANQTVTGLIVLGLAALVIIIMLLRNA